MCTKIAGLQEILEEIQQCLVYVCFKLLNQKEANSELKPSIDHSGFFIEIKMDSILFFGSTETYKCFHYFQQNEKVNVS